MDYAIRGRSGKLIGLLSKVENNQWKVKVNKKKAQTLPYLKARKMAAKAGSITPLRYEAVAEMYLGHRGML